jgi:mannose PTS system EIIA component
MIGLVLVTHGRLAEEFRSALEHVVGQQTHVATISMHPDDDVESRRGDIIKAVGTVDSGRGVVILTDMFGGTPSNLAISVMETGKVEVIAGMNLPMLVKLASVRGEVPLEQAVEQAQEAGRKYINVASRLLGSQPERSMTASAPVTPSRSGASSRSSTPAACMPAPRPNSSSVPSSSMPISG